MERPLGIPGVGHEDNLPYLPCPFNESVRQGTGFTVLSVVTGPS